MSRFLFATMPLAGHVNPGLPIARALVERGHVVRWYTGRQFRAAIETTGASFAPMEAGIDPADVSIEERFPERARLSGLAGLRFDLKYLFLDAVPAQVADLQSILRRFPADVVLGDTGFLGLSILHELGGPPWATYGITALTLSSRDIAPFGLALPPSATLFGRARNALLTAVLERVLLGDVQTHLEQLRAEFGLKSKSAPILNTLSPFLYLQASTPAFEYPRSDLPPQVHFVGPLLPAPPAGFAPPIWWPELRGTRPVVLVTQGTLARDAADLMLPAITGMANKDVLVIVATGGASPKALAQLWAEISESAVFLSEARAPHNFGLTGGHGPGVMLASKRYRAASRPPAELPANVRVAPFLPFGELLPHVDVMVTNGGYGGVQFALAHGVPLVVAGATEDKLEIAARVAWSGTGINLNTRRPTPRQIDTAVRTVLADARYRTSAQRVRDDYAGSSGPGGAALLLERLAHTGHSVPRDERAVGAPMLPA
jgi:UDP:flavonoid glycosyltransferase YjiC (YdhE family)